MIAGSEPKAAIDLIARPGATVGTDRPIFGSDACPFDLIEPPVSFDEFGDEFAVPFEVVPVRGAKVVWRNERWFAEQGVLLEAEENVRALDAWLLERFAVTAYSGSAGRGCNVLWADRYGGSRGAPHGGSGRCGFLGRFNAKGIGRTPLVPSGLSSHQDGRLSLNEAIREAICAEIAAVELPAGAVPVLAIISVPAPDGAGGMDAIVVRPNFVRLAHMERSIYFGTAGTQDSDQYRDGLRVRSVVRHLFDARPLVAPLSDLVVRSGRQIGAMHAHRLWQGRYLSSNIEISGALLDFGSFRSVPSWRAYFGEREEVFGREPLYLRRAADTWSRTLRKHLGSVLMMEADLEALVSSSVRDGFDRAIDDVIFGEPVPDRTSERLRLLLWHRFRAEQRTPSQIGDAPDVEVDWPDLTAQTRNDSFSQQLRAEVDLAARALAASPASLISRLSLWLMPRPQLSYERQAARIADLVIRYRRGGLSQRIASYIDRTISLNRRRFAGLPSGFSPTGHAVVGRNSWLFGRVHGRGPAIRLLLTANPARSSADGTNWAATPPIVTMPADDNGPAVPDLCYSEG